jgi:putative endonuclease
MVEQCKETAPVPEISARAVVGRSGEDAAVVYYRSLGIKLVARNWRAGRFAEVDLILRSPDGMYIFAEVKTRLLRAGEPEMVESGFASVGFRKQKKIVTAARIFISRLPQADIPCRFDVLVVSYERNAQAGASERIIHVADAFSG